jgi:hypothetical protein
MTRLLQGPLVSLPRDRSDRRYEAEWINGPFVITQRRMQVIEDVIRWEAWSTQVDSSPLGTTYRGRELTDYLDKYGACSVYRAMSVLRRLRKQYGVKGRICETLLDSDRWYELITYWKRKFEVEKEDWSGCLATTNYTRWLLMKDLHWIAFVPVKDRLRNVKHRRES